MSEFQSYRRALNEAGNSVSILRRCPQRWLIEVLRDLELPQWGHLTIHLAVAVGKECSLCIPAALQFCLSQRHMCDGTSYIFDMSGEFRHTKILSVLGGD